ncbi:MAG TPA: hypothetical protein ENF26_00550 [Methanomicrobia archaeon]|nr:hypothetical protein [Methanomicrobia archaeon]HEX58628.1 hypothetical protein [Methanomicrobia archaeon]
MRDARKTWEQYHIIRVLRSDKDTHFTGALDQYEVERENIEGLLSNNIIIKQITMLSEQRLNYRLHFFSKDSFESTDPDEDAYIGWVDFDLSTHGIQYGGSGLWRLSVVGEGEGLLRYIDEDGTKELHVALENLDATAKNAGSGGYVVIVVFYTILEYS